MVKGVPQALTRVVGALAAASLPQSITNGDSLLGTLEAPKYGAFLEDNSPVLATHKVSSNEVKYPWGSMTAEGDNPYNCPKRETVRKYDFTVHRAIIAPDGVEKEAIVVNNQFPGPTIEANWGDWIEVKVTNGLLEEGTSIHWHGLLQKETPFMDGVPSVMQCPIAPGQTFTYRFRADIAGTSWWHSHYGGQYTAGLAGPMIIHGPGHNLKKYPKAAYDEDLGPVFLSDWFHRPHAEIIDGLMGTVPDEIVTAITSQNNLINGKMAFDCTKTTQKCTDGAGISQFQFESGKKYKLRVINAGAEAQEEFSIDGHMLTVIAHDFVQVKPYTVPSIVLANGQRADIIVEATGNPNKSYFMRATIGSCAPATQPYALAAVHYENADTTKVPDSEPRPDLINNCDVDFPIKDIIPIYKEPAHEPDYTVTIDMVYEQNATGYFLWEMNDVSFRANFNKPLLPQVVSGNFDFPETASVYNTRNAKTIRIILNNKGMFDFLRHPMHLHGHNMQIIHVGPGEWDGKTIVNPKNPLRRDTQVLPGKGHMVMQFQADNPGLWPYHCHIAWHSSQGLLVNILERVREIKRGHYKIPKEVTNGCKKWEFWSKYHVVPQIDAGV